MRFIAVDDEPFALSDIAGAIREAEPEAELNEFRSPKAALEFASRNTVDVAFLDIEMGGLNGLELAKKLKDIHRKTNIVFVTGYSEYALDAFSVFACGYVLKPVTREAVKAALENLRHPIDRKKGIFVQTFGSFELFLDGRPIAFSRSKAKEAFAYLIDRRGASVRAAEIAAVLWPDKEYTRSLQSQTQTLIASIMQTLRENGIEDIIIKKWNKISVDKMKISCDYYDFLSGDLRAVNTYGGEYMTNYSWAEMTTGVLSQKTKII